MGISVGVDIGQQADPTAIVMVDTYRPEPTAPKEWPDVRHCVRWIERVPLGTLYGAVVERVAVVAEAAQTWGSTMIVLDATGVGRPVWDMLRARTGVAIRAVVFTAAEAETQPEYNVHRVPNRDLVTSVEVVLQRRCLEVVPDCPLQADLNAELAAFDFSISARTGHDRYEAAAGSHDDLVMALGLALWWAERPSPVDAWVEACRRRVAR